MLHRLPSQRWSIATPKPEDLAPLTEQTGLSPLIVQVLYNRGILNPQAAQIYLEPETENLPSPLAEFPDLGASVALLAGAITNREKIAICGDYDADGMTSTALLLRALRHLGAEVDYAIPSRMQEGYGINTRIVEEFAQTGVGLILTVDNGISAHAPIARARELGLKVIITDHHDLPPTLPVANAILNPKLLPLTSPYRGLAGVGVAYVLAITTAQKLDRLGGLTSQLLELFTLGTIADLAPLVGVNRRWLRRGLKRLPKSDLAGVQALMQMAGIKEEQKQLKPDDIGFKLGPRINAVGRIGDPQVVIELLTTDDLGLALERAMQCEEINRQRQELCEKIEQEAIKLVEETPIPWQNKRVLVVVNANWHHGVIGIVASRLVERYGVPVFIGSYEEHEPDKIRGSARGIKEFNIFAALQFCEDVLGKYGGHQAAGGFSLEANNLEIFKFKLSEFACKLIEPKHLKPLINIDAQADFRELNEELYQQIDSLQPWGIGNDFPVFWTPDVRVIEQETVGKNHLKITLAQVDGTRIKAIAWRWREYFPLPSFVDIAYKIQKNIWQGQSSIELEIVGVRASTKEPAGEVRKSKFIYKGRSYGCSFWESLDELRIKNEQGQILVIKKGSKVGLLGFSRNEAQKVDVTQTHYKELIQIAKNTLCL
jgi:single-stranded-DNA-specific exonuclease